MTKGLGDLHNTRLHATVGKVDSFVEASAAGGPPTGPIKISVGDSIAADPEFVVLSDDLTALVSQFNSKQSASPTDRPEAGRPTEAITFSVAGVASTAGDVEDLNARALERIRAFVSGRRTKK